MDRMSNHLDLRPASGRPPSRATLPDQCPAVATIPMAKCGCFPPAMRRRSRRLASSQATGWRRRWRSRRRRCSSISDASAPARSFCRSTRPTRSPRSEYFVGDARPALIVGDPARRDGLAEIAKANGARFETLGADGSGSLAEIVAATDRRMVGHRARPGRPCGNPLHLGHDRPLEGRDADAREPPVQCRGAGRDVALHIERCADPRAADFSHARPLRRHQRQPGRPARR